MALKHRIGTYAHTHTHIYPYHQSKIPTSIALPIIVCSKEKVKSKYKIDWAL